MHLFGASGFYMYESSLSLLLYPSSSDLEQLGMTHSMGEGDSCFTWIDSVLLLGFIMLSYNNSGLNRYRTLQSLTLDL